MQVETDGAAALAAVGRLHPVAVVLDIGLPGLDGVEVCRRLRAEDDWTPVLFVTARDDEVDRIARPRAGRRRLRHQAVQPARAGRPGPRPCCAAQGGAPQPRGGAGDGARSASQVDRRRVHVDERRGRADRHRVRPAGPPHAGTRRGCSPASSCWARCGATPPRPAPAPSTCTSPSCAPSSARRARSARCAASATPRSAVNSPSPHRCHAAADGGPDPRRGRSDGRRRAPARAVRGRRGPVAARRSSLASPQLPAGRRGRVGRRARRVRLVASPPGRSPRTCWPSRPTSSRRSSPTPAVGAPRRGGAASRRVVRRAARPGRHGVVLLRRGDAERGPGRARARAGRRRSGRSAGVPVSTERRRRAATGTSSRPAPRSSAAFALVRPADTGPLGSGLVRRNLGFALLAGIAVARRRRVWSSAR